jgi:hypothetical protein
LTLRLHRQQLGQLDADLFETVSISELARGLLKAELKNFDSFKVLGWNCGWVETLQLLDEKWSVSHLFLRGVPVFWLLNKSHHGSDAFFDELRGICQAFKLNDIAFLELLQSILTLLLLCG